MSFMTKLFTTQTLANKHGCKIAVVDKKRLIMPTLLSVLLVSFVFGSETNISLNHNFYLLANQNFAQDSLSATANWQPRFEISHKTETELELQMEYSCIVKASANCGDEKEADFSLEHYRSWVRFALPQSSLRIGLQRLSIGSAQIIRPLQWFDRIDPLDKSEETMGVKAALFKHNWLNNSNLWLWSVWGEDTVKGNEFIASKDNSAEFGARYQRPNPLGESALSCHLRQLLSGQEYRLGFDHRYDGPIGAWLEASASRFDTSLPLPGYSTGLTIGLDYTIGIGNGLALTNENMLLNRGDTIAKLHADNVITALMTNYPLGLLDSLTLLALYDYTFESGNLAVVWRRAYDYLSWDVSIYLDSGYDKSVSASPSLSLKISYSI